MQTLAEEAASVNWAEDDWFARHTPPHAMSEGFKRWWVFYYGTPEEHRDTPEETHEYWVRCRFALMGWRARENNKEDK